MTKPISGPLSDLVRSRPVESPTEQNRTEQNNPPNPPQAGGTVSPADRAREGSRRLRDLAALAAEQAEERQLVEPDPNAASAWSSMLAALRPTLPESGYVYWLAPVVAIGSLDGKIVLESPRKLDWYERRYAAALNELAALNGYNGWAIYAGRGGPIA